MRLGAAYVAGLIDGEGWIGIGTSKDVYTARVTVGMTLPAKAILEALRDQWGGSLYMSRPATSKWSEAWVWTIGGQPADTMLMAIRPYLQIKPKQADLVMEVERLRRELPRRPNGSAAWNTGTRTRCERIRAELNRLNKKGPRPATNAAVSSGRRIATWNPARGVWETDQAAVVCGHLVPFLATWPTSGMTRDGVAYELPTSARRTEGSGSSSLPGLLPTPTTSDSNGTGVHGTGGRDLRTEVSLLPTPDANMGNGGRIRSQEVIDARSRQIDLDNIAKLLPTPRATDGTKGGPNQRGSSGDMMLPSAVLLPTPTATAYGNSGDHTDQPSTDGSEPSDE